MTQLLRKKWLIVIPSRLASTRLAHKPLQDICGKPLIKHVFDVTERLRAAGARVICAIDDQKTKTVCDEHDIPCELTDPDLPSGTDRVWQVAQQHSCDMIMNLQGDEPFMDSDDLLQLAFAAESSPLPIGTLAFEQHDTKKFLNPNIVKAVVSHKGEGLYFSRSPIPYFRDTELGEKTTFWQHMGVYTFHKQALQEFCALKPSYLERSEKLEQLRALENGMRILVVPASAETLAIDTPDDLQRARLLMTERQKARGK